ncbi:MAG: hypothetical protein WD098_00545 [Balneolales bacterium]
MTLILDRNKALEIMTLVVDNEATKSEIQAFMHFINQEENQDIQIKFQEEKLIKQLIIQKYKRQKAPTKLYDFICNLNRYKK